MDIRLSRDERSEKGLPNEHAGRELGELAYAQEEGRSSPAR